MPQTITAPLDVTDETTNELRIRLTGSGTIIAGGNGAGSTLILKNRDDKIIAMLGLVSLVGPVKDGSLILSDADGKTSLRFLPDQLHVGNLLRFLEGELELGGSGKNGRLSLKDGDRNEVVSLAASDGEMKIGGMLRFKDGTLRLGSGEKDGKLLLRNSEGKETMSLDGKTRDMEVRSGTFTAKNESNKIVTRMGLIERHIGGPTGDGGLLIADENGKGVLSYESSAAELSINKKIYLDGKKVEVKVGDSFHYVDGALRIGKDGKDGVFYVMDAGQGVVMSFDGRLGEIKVRDSFHYVDGALRIGKGGRNGVFFVMNAAESVVMSMDGGTGELRVKDSMQYRDGTLTLGAGQQHGSLVMKNAEGRETIRVDGQMGDITTPNGDCAEEFDLAGGQERVPGAVMVLDEDGSLRQSYREYDTAVAGVVSGAGSYKPALIMDKRAGDSQRVPLAVVGKVFCLVDAEFGAVRPGSLLTTSPRPGHAMLAADHARAFGAVLGKALKPLDRGRGLVPVMVALQ